MANPNWVKGVSGNPKGAPRKPEIAELRKALREAKKSHKGKSFINSYVERAYTNSPMAIALLKKLVPDLNESDLGDVAAMTIADILAKVKGSE